MLVEEVIVRVDEKESTSATEGYIDLSPYDLANKGSTIPMGWFYETTLDVKLLLGSLKSTLQEYPVFCGRYEISHGSNRVILNNAGVPVHVCSVDNADMRLSEAMSHIPTSTTSSIFLKGKLEPFLPSREGMHPDIGSSDSPLLSIKITLFPSGGTVIGTCIQHGISDADSIITFMRNWSRVFRGEAIDPKPIHSRKIVNELDIGDIDDEQQPPESHFKVVPPGEKNIPEFMAVMPKIMGAHVAVVGLCNERLKEMKAAANAGLEKEGTFISTDDILTAHIWRLFCEMRCVQIGISTDSEEITTIARACNFRKRTEPQLGDGYCGNGVSQVWSQLSVRQLMASTPTEIAMGLRADLQKQSSMLVGARARWLQKMQDAGSSTTIGFDALGLTFILSSWRFDWEAANFNAVPVCFDHAAHVPIVSVITPRPHDDGLNVYVSGPQHALGVFSERLIQATGAV